MYTFALRHFSLIHMRRREEGERTTGSCIFKRNGYTLKWELNFFLKKTSQREQENIMVTFPIPQTVTLDSWKYENTGPVSHCSEQLPDGNVWVWEWWVYSNLIWCRDNTSSLSACITSCFTYSGTSYNSSPFLLHLRPLSLPQETGTLSQALRIYRE